MEDEKRRELEARQEALDEAFTRLSHVSEAMVEVNDLERALGQLLEHHDYTEFRSDRDALRALWDRLNKVKYAIVARIERNTPIGE